MIFIIFYLIVLIVLLIEVLKDYRNRKKMEDFPEIEQGPLDDDMVIFYYGGERFQMRFEEADKFDSLTREQKRQYIRKAKELFKPKVMTEAEAKASKEVSKNDPFSKKAIVNKQ